MRFRRALLCLAVLGAALRAGVAHAQGPATLPASAGASDVSVAVDPNGVAYVAATVDGAAKLWRVDRDAAMSLAPGGVFGAVPGGPAGSLAVDAAGDVHEADLGRASVVIRRSIDGGASWDRGSAFAGPPARAVSLAAAQFNSLVEGATLTLVDDLGGTKLVMRSSDGGLTFTPGSVLDSDCPSTACPLGDVATDASGQQIVAVSSGAGDVLVDRSTDGGLTFSRSAAGSYLSAELPSVAILSDGTRLIAWREYGGVEVSRSAPGSADGWDSLQGVGDQVTGARIAAGNGVTAAMAWLEYGDGAWRLVGATSADDGVSFGAKIVLDVLGDAMPRGRVALAGDQNGGFVAAYAAPDGARVVRF